VATIYLGPTSPSTSVRPTWCSAGSLQTHRLGLAPEGVCLAADVAAGAGALLPHPFNLTGTADCAAAPGGLLSVALFHASPRLGVTQHPALWSPDFPRPEGRGRLANSQYKR